MENKVTKALIEYRDHLNAKMSVLVDRMAKMDPSKVDYGVLVSARIELQEKIDAVQAKIDLNKKK